MDQILSNIVEVCSFIIVSLGIVQNSYLIVLIILCTKTIYNYITLQKTYRFFDVNNFLMRKWISFSTSCAEIHVNSKHKLLGNTMFCSFFFFLKVLLLSNTFLPVSHVPVLVAEKQLLFLASLNTNIAQRLLLFSIKQINLTLREQNPSIHSMSSLVFYCTWQGQIILVIIHSYVTEMFNFATACSILILCHTWWKTVEVYCPLFSHKAASQWFIGYYRSNERGTWFSSYFKGLFSLCTPPLTAYALYNFIHLDGTSPSVTSVAHITQCDW